LLFTHTGVSGPAVLTISRDLPTESAAYSGGDVRLRIDLLPSLKESERDEKILHLISEFPNRSLLRVLRGLAPEAYLRNLLDRIGLEADRACHDIRREERKLLRDAIHGLRFTVAEPPSYKEAMITAGGVDTAFVDPRTMESRCIPGLFFAGEILDIDAITGGYNLQIAFSTGYLAGRAAVRI
jgi:predicted Rossmann fold flavoprotein